MFNNTQAFVEVADASPQMTLSGVASVTLLISAAYYAHTFIQMPDRKVNGQTSSLGLFATVIGRDFATVQILFEFYSIIAPFFPVLKLPTAHPSPLSPAAALGALILIAGGALRAHAYRTMGKNYLFDLRVGRSHSLVTWGPYALVRHPMYLGLGLVHVGWATLLWPGNGGALVRTWPALALACWATVVLGGTVLFGFVASRAKAEDEMLRGHFGKEWDRWAERTKYKVVPGIY
ncbi:Protein-S-isoprenylcysteine O-methyltransferase, partial [Rhizoctonia solani]